MGEMRNHVVVITGASSGFGRGAALKFAEAGASVVLAARRKRLLRQIARECRDAGAEPIVVETDVSDSSDVQDLAKRAVGTFGKIDVWVNNAGVGALLASTRRHWKSTSKSSRPTSWAQSTVRIRHCSSSAGAAEVC